jgi:hypothetical protein
VAPVGPQDAGEIGGDIQMGAAWSRRFALRRPDGQWAVITDSFYAACHDGVSGPVTDESELYVQNQIEWQVCTDLRDLGGTETWSDYETRTRTRSGCTAWTSWSGSTSGPGSGRRASTSTPTPGTGRTNR